MSDRKELLRQYKETARPAGVFRVHNVAETRSLIGSSVDLPGMLNRQRFQLEMGSHPNKELQADWNRLGEKAFVIDVVDELDPGDEPGADPRDDARELEQMWIERLTASGVALYNRHKP